MNDTSSLKIFRKRFAFSLLIVFIVHVGIALFFVFAGGDSGVYPRWVKLYRSISHIGPFFRTESMKGTYHAVVQIQNHVHGNRVVQLSHDYVQAYHHQPWRFDRLVLRDYLRTLSGGITRERKLQRNHLAERYSNQLNDFVNRQVRLNKGDSATYFFIWKKFRPSVGYDPDTLLVLPISIRHVQ